MDRRTFLASSSFAALGLSHGIASAEEADVVLHNGIRLGKDWPQARRAIDFEPMEVPYLRQRPEVIPIDVGRQLFVDDFLIEQTDLRRVYHTPRYRDPAPVVRPDEKWEMTGRNPTAMVFSDGVWFDPQDQKFKMWYMGGYVRSVCYAESRDGDTWTKPKLDVVPGTNIVLDGYRDSNTVWLDHEEKDPKKRVKMFRVARDKPMWAIEMHESPDGIRWGPGRRSGPLGDRSTVHFDPFRKRWVFGIRDHDARVGRYRRWHENADAAAGLAWQTGQPHVWVGADRLDPIRDDLKTPCQLYNLDCVAYESLMIGLFDIWRGQPRDRAKPNELCIGFSRDGYHWHRPVRTAFLPVSERFGDWNWGNVQSAGGVCLVVRDKLLFYVSGRSGIRGNTESGTSVTALATLRRDGFASMVAEEAGTLTTRPLRFRGSHLFVNGDFSQGSLEVEAIDARGNPIEPFTRANFRPIRTDGVKLPCGWNGAGDVAKLAGQPVRFRFRISKGSLFAFWVSSSAEGESRGYVAAGGPGFRGPIDG